MYNLGRCVGYKIDLSILKAYVLDINPKEHKYLIEYKDSNKTHQEWVHKKYLTDWKAS